MSSAPVDNPTDQNIDQNTEGAAIEREEQELVSVAVDELIIGRKIGAPIFDCKGLLLLASGSEITAEIKQNLKARSLDGQIQISEADLDNVTLRKIETEEITLFQIDENLTKKIDLILDNGLFNFDNNGPALKQEVQSHGKNDYSSEQRDQLINLHSENGQKLSSLMNSAMDGDLPDGHVIGDIATTYLKNMISDTDNVLTSIIGSEINDEITAQSLESSLLAMAIAIEMDFDEENVKNLGIAGILHDWGMCRIPANIRNSPKRFSRLERLEIEKHPLYTLDILNQIPSLPRQVPIIAYQVHEQPNGKGYPRGKKGEQIPILSRILAVADTFSSLTHKRPYRPPLSRYAAMETILRLSNRRALDSEVVRALLRLQSLFPLGSYIAIDDGSVAQVMRPNHDHYTQPIVRRIQDKDGNQLDMKDSNQIIDLVESDLFVQQAMMSPGSGESTNAFDHLDFWTKK